MDTIRTTGKYEDYFLHNWDKIAVENNKHLYVGHYHVGRVYPNITIVDSTGYNNNHYEIGHRSGTICIDADIHLGIPETDSNVINMIARWTTSGYDKIILQGDVLEMQELTDDELDTKMHKLGFYKFLESYKGKIVWVIGNHDINILSSELHKRLLDCNPGILFCEYHYLDSMMFTHGHQFDPHIKNWGKFYYLIFKIGDYLNLPKKIINWLVKTFK